jgi:hypothetical protein
MSTLENKIKEARATKIKITEEELIAFLDDGRTIAVPLSWYPRLLNGSEKERNNWRFIGEGIGIHWPELDEDISVEGLIDGIPSQESQSSLKKWLQTRGKIE